MKFKNIENGTGCSCLEDAVVDEVPAYLHYIDSPSVKTRDFASKWERYEKSRPEELPSQEDCKVVCAWKGVSVNKVDGYDEDEVYRVYTEPYRYVPEKERNKRRILKFTLGANTGMVQHTPNTEHDSHHDLFKCDTFDVAAIATVLVSKIEFI